MLSTIVSNSYFGKRSIAREMNPFSVPCWRPKCNFYWSYFAMSAVWPSPGLICGLLLLPCAWEMELWVYQLWRLDFLWIYSLSTINRVFQSFITCQLIDTYYNIESCPIWMVRNIMASSIIYLLWVIACKMIEEPR